jgi:hypothetical protein
MATPQEALATALEALRAVVWQALEVRQAAAVRQVQRAVGQRGAVARQVLVAGVVRRAPVATAVRQAPVAAPRAP